VYCFAGLETLTLQAYLQNRVPRICQEPTHACHTIQIIDSFLVSFHPEELRLMLLPSLPSGSIRAMADLDAGCITEAGSERLHNMHGRCHDSICVINSEMPSGSEANIGRNAGLNLFA
jgi:hypothetical protein